MAVTATYQIIPNHSQDVTYSQKFSPAVSNTQSDGGNFIVNLAAGNNSIAIPQLATAGMVTAGYLIIPPTGNTTQITLKGASGDTGIVLHTTNPTLISFHTTQTTFVLSVASTLQLVRFIRV